MELLDALKEDHQTIEAVAYSLVTFAQGLESGASKAGDGERFVRFFQLFAGRYHHGREEQVLFPALVRETEVTTDRGPLAALLADHAAMVNQLDAFAASLTAPGPRSLEVATGYVTALLHHIDAENSVLFPEAEVRFRRASVSRLDDRALDDEERAARDDGLRLVQHYPAAVLPELIRGDGCVCCPSYGVTCDGVEREWSSEEEWEDMLDRAGH